MAKTSKGKGNQTALTVRQRLRLQPSVATRKRKRRKRERSTSRALKLEMKKVVWPTKKELGFIHRSQCLATCAAFALVFWAVDTGVLAAIKGSMFLKRAMNGSLKIQCVKTTKGKKLDLEGLEGLRGDGEAKWYVVHTYSGHENKVKGEHRKNR